MIEQNNLDQDQQQSADTPTANEAVDTQQQASDSSLKTQINDRGSVAEAKEIGGPKGLEPTRYGDWESKGRCYDF